MNSSHLTIIQPTKKKAKIRYWVRQVGLFGDPDGHDPWLSIIARRYQGGCARTLSEPSLMTLILAHQISPKMTGLRDGAFSVFE